jgi:hypothetical protein
MRKNAIFRSEENVLQSPGLFYCHGRYRPESSDLIGDKIIIS